MEIGRCHRISALAGTTAVACQAYCLRSADGACCSRWLLVLTTSAEAADGSATTTVAAAISTTGMPRYVGCDAAWALLVISLFGDVCANINMYVDRAEVHRITGEMFIVGVRLFSGLSRKEVGRQHFAIH